MKEQLQRTDVTEEFKSQINNKISVLNEQKKDLEDELTELFYDVFSGKRKLKVYRQFKNVQRPFLQNKKMNFLIIVYKGIGDVVLTTPLVKAIKKKIPQSSVYFLTKKYSAPILSNNPYIDEVLVREELSLKKLRSLKINVSIDYMLSSSSAFYSMASGAEKRIAFYRDWGFLAYNCMLKINFTGYNVRQKFEYLRPLGIDPDSIEDIKPDVYPSESDFEKIKEYLFSKNIDVEKNKIVNMDITSPRAYRQLSADKFIFIADKLVENGFKTVFAPNSNEYDYVKNAIDSYSKYKDNHIILKNLSLMQLSALISLAKLHIGTSSAPMHIAVAFDVPTFTVYSPHTSPLSWDPGGERHRYVQGDLDKLQAADLWDKIRDFISRLEV